MIQVYGYLPEHLLNDLKSETAEARIKEMDGTILTTMADQCLVTPLYYTRQLAVYNDKVADYVYVGDTSFISVQNILAK